MSQAVSSAQRAWGFRARHREAVCVGLILLATAVATWISFWMLAPAILHISTYDYWFESDPPAIIKQLSDRFTLANGRASRHPLYALVMYPCVSALRALPGVDLVAAVGLACAGIAAIWAAAFFLLLRLVGLRLVDAMAFTTLALVGSSAVFWLPVPETAAPAALTLLLALAALAWHENTGRLPWAACVLVSVVTLSMTVTNAVAGFLTCLLVLGWKRGLAAIASSLALVAGGQFVERLYFPHTKAFFLPAAAQEAQYLFNPLGGSAWDRIAGFFLHGFIIPPLQQGYAGYLSVQQAHTSSVPAPVLVGWGLWLALLAAGLVGLSRSGRLNLRSVLLCVLASQLAFVLVFGQETFVYLLLSGPLLVALAAFGCLTPYRHWVLAGAAILALLAGIENGRRFAEAAGLLNHRYAASQAFVQALSVRTGPMDPIVLGLPPAEAEGLPPRAVWRVHAAASITRLPSFDSVPLERKGWHLPYGHWTETTLDTLRQAGARYFATLYVYGVRSDSTVQRYLGDHARAVAETPDWVIYELRPTPDTSQLTDRAPTQAPEPNKP